MGIAFLLMLYKMIDGELPFVPGIAGMGFLMFLLAMSVKPVHPAIPGIIFVVVLTAMGLAPFAANQLEQVELKAFETDRLIRLYENYVQRPDNVAALLKIADHLYQNGLRANAIAIASATLNSLSNQPDAIHNRSQRDYFRTEDYALQRWIRETGDISLLKPVPCPSCGAVSRPEFLLCETCGRPYLIDIVNKMHNVNVAPKVYGKLVLSFGAIATLIVVCSAVGLYFSGVFMFLMMVIAIAGVAALLNYLFRAPQPS